ncbi:hypothetical protein DLAC_02743 [Tieghemostelium lacteum]|uniref:Uncharacterized protein n=1 Tax=Tieghemostelium lacteum TaxID=361077 RepID=A0A152A368_TIELA|nr:hypothetical protein DLAC_02743 [Tieghemostelium lacteum]|eukprot:KYR00703.1 hypothetical protein DLAC_02743 [Tieghemostelium lacteum]
MNRYLVKSYSNEDFTLKSNIELNEILLQMDMLYKEYANILPDKGLKIRNTIKIIEKLLNEKTSELRSANEKKILNDFSKISLNSNNNCIINNMETNRKNNYMKETALNVPLKRENSKTKYPKPHSIKQLSMEESIIDYKKNLDRLNLSLDELKEIDSPKISIPDSGYLAPEEIIDVDDKEMENIDPFIDHPFDQGYNFKLHDQYGLFQDDK